MREREAHERRLSSQMRSQAHFAQALDSKSDLQKQYDFFISHASEDKEGFVRQLVEALRSKDVEFWYDEITIGWGDSLRRKIDQGLANTNGM